MKTFAYVGAAALGLVLLSCASQPMQTAGGPDAQLKAVAAGIAAACPASAADTSASRDACSERLGRLAALDSATPNPPGILWGGMAKDGDFEPTHSKLTRLDGLVWRKLYLSLFSFPGTYTIEAWHEKLGTKSGTVTVTEGGAATTEFTFGPATS